MVVGRNNGVVRLTGFSDKKMSGLLFGPQKSDRNNGVVVWRDSTVLCSLMSRIDLVSKNLLANCIRNFSIKDLKKTAIRKI